MQLMCAWLFWKISRQICEQYATYDFEPKIAKYNLHFINEMYVIYMH